MDSRSLGGPKVKRVAMRKTILLALTCIALCACGPRPVGTQHTDKADSPRYEFIARTTSDLDAIAIDRALEYRPFWTNDALTLGLRAKVGVGGVLQLTRTGFPVSYVRVSSLDIEADASAWALLREMGGFDGVHRISAGCTEGSGQDMIQWLAEKQRVGSRWNERLGSITISMHSFDGVSIAPLRKLEGPISLELRPYYNQPRRILPKSLLDELQLLHNVDSVDLTGSIDRDAHAGLVNLLGKRRLKRFVVIESAIDDPALVIAALTSASVVWLRVTQACLEAVAGSLTPDQTFGVEGLYLEVPVGARDAAMKITSRCPRLFDLSFKWTRP